MRFLNLVGIGDITTQAQKLEQFNRILVTGIDRSKPAEETTWIYQAERFVKETFRDWETGGRTLLVPCVEDKNEWIKIVKDDPGKKAERSIILSLYELGKSKKLPMFITYNRNFSHLIKMKDVGGGTEDLVTGEHDIVLIHREFGVVFMQVKNLSSKSKVKENVQKAKKQLKNDVLSLKATVQESGSGDVNVSLCVLALANVKRSQVEAKSLSDMPVPTVFLCEEDLETAESIERWWNEQVLHQLSNSIIDSRTYLKLLAIYIAPVYATPAYTARMTTQDFNFLTADKLDILVNGPKEFTVKGAAGTGKTWLLQEKIRNIVMSWFSDGPIQDKDEKILVVCFNKHLANHFFRTLSYLLLKSAMAMLNRWRKEIEEENEKRKVRQIIVKNLVICCMTPYEQKVWGGEFSGTKGTDKAASVQANGEDNEEICSANQNWRIRNATWELFAFHRFFENSFVRLPRQKMGRWPLKNRIVRRLFQSFAPEPNSMNFLDASLKIIALEEVNHPLQLISKGSVGKSMLGMSSRLSECRDLVMDLPQTMQHVVLADVQKILKTRMPPFHHIFVDEAEDLCQGFEDHWLTSFRSLHKGAGGYFWQAYDPLSFTSMPASLKKNLEGAHSLLAVLRNPGSVLETWTTKLSSEQDFKLYQSGTRDPTYKRDEILSGHDIQGPKVENFPVSSSHLAERILETLRDKFGSGTHPGDIVILFAYRGDFFFHKDRLRKELESKFGTSPSSPRLLVEYANFFKGMEAPIVFLITNQREKERGQFYIGASRSTSYLIQLAMEASEQEDEAAEEAHLQEFVASLPTDASEEYKESAKRRWGHLNFIS
ncbi:unnamed protein product [Darwinula stevensoni]|uniref:DNA helicase n=1 Tax=Darwinula stevensoni TaxID=69355 RepID=A0A7R8XCD0_9CRUS|nr:unnamed protein product [Darwinula stevensoni]CAG0893666.1 unnamed protein product [Darwinula stevensoni]